MFKYEFHAHCSECSKCASGSAEEMVKAFHEAGYAGMVFTDHCCCGYSAVPEEWSWEQRVTFYYNTYLRAKAYGETLDFDVHFGWEHYVGRGKEILTYGIDLDFLLSNPDIPSMSVSDYCAAVRAYGGYTAQAHPYRRRPDIDELWHPFIDDVDGLEVYNAANGPCHNAKAMLLAVAHPELGRLSGADAHHPTDSVGRAGLCFSHRLQTTEELIAALKAGEGQLIVDSKPMETLDDFLTAKPL